MYSVKEVASKLGLNKATIYLKIATGELEHYKIGKKAIRISDEQINRFLENCKNKATKTRGKNGR